MRIFRYMILLALNANAFENLVLRRKANVKPLQMVRTRGLETRIDGATPKGNNVR